ncbi:MAG: FAD:protein FMN transferase [Eubacterium sp.]|nr:FAD:protein FMN transferase [Eubacterium sp.]
MKKLIVCLLCAVLVLGGCETESIPRSFSAFYFDTYITFTLYDTDNGKSDKEIIDNCKNLLGELEQKLTAHADGGLISQINETAFANPVVIDKETFGLIKRCAEISRMTDGAFDITLGDISALWGFSAERTSPPDFYELKQLAGKRNYDNIVLDESELTVSFLTDDFSLDLGAAAKGYALDRLKEQMKSDGVTSAVIDFGGNIQTVGDAPPGAEHWGVAITADETNTTIGKITVNETCVSTSNASRRYVEYDGVRYHHIIDGMTAFPADSDIKSVTVICEDGVYADALSTAFFVMGSERALTICDELENVEAVITLKDGDIVLSGGAKEIFAK